MPRLPQDYFKTFSGLLQDIGEYLKTTSRMIKPLYDYFKNSLELRLEYLKTTSAYFKTNSGLF